MQMSLWIPSGIPDTFVTMSPVHRVEEEQGSSGKPKALSGREALMVMDRAQRPAWAFVQFWATCFKKAVGAVEQSTASRAGVKLRRGLEHESCGGRLKDPRLLSLEERKPGSTKPQVV